MYMCLCNQHCGTFYLKFIWILYTHQNDEIYLWSVVCRVDSRSALKYIGNLIMRYNIPNHCKIKYLRYTTHIHIASDTMPTLRDSLCINSTHDCVSLYHHNIIGEYYKAISSVQLSLDISEGIIWKQNTFSTVENFTKSFILFFSDS